MDVIFEPKKGKPFSIEVGFFDTILEIKEKIQKYHNIPISKQTLIFNNHVLQDDRDVEFCEILQNSRIQLDIASESPEKPTSKSETLSPIPNPSLGPSQIIHLNIKPPTSKMHIPIEMDINDTIGKLKEKIHNDHIKIVQINRLILHSCSVELQDHNRSLSEYALSDNSQIDVSFKPPPTPIPSATGSGNTTTTMSGPTNTKKLKVMVLTKPGMKKVEVVVNSTENVGELKKELEKMHQRLHNFQMPQEDYFFIYKQNVMEEDRSFRWHHVGQGDTIEIFHGSVTGGS